jgi:acetyltransferase-like isoleucine patch superfamily enzyme
MFIILIPAFVHIGVTRNRTLRRKRFCFWSEFVSLWPFELGILSRRLFYERTLQECGENPVTRMGVIFIHPETEIGDNVYIGNQSAIALSSIGDSVMISSGVLILSGRHHHKGSHDRDIPVRLRETRSRRVSVGNNVWIGANATIMSDIGDNAIVGAGAVVVKPVPAGTTVVGNPATALTQQNE